MSKTLYLSDLDGTLLNKSGGLSDFSRDKLNEMIRGGLNFSVVTGRRITTSKFVLSALDLKLPIAVMNGAVIFDLLNDECLQSFYLPKNTISVIIDTVKKYKNTCFMDEFKDNDLVVYHEALTNERDRGFVAERKRQVNMSFEQLDSLYDAGSDNKISFSILGGHDLVKPVCDTLNKEPGLSCTFYKDVYNSDLWYLEVYSANATKGTAVSYYRDKLNFDKIVCFGDNLNDMPMFHAADVKVCVENSMAEVLETADFVCGKSYEDGVVKWLMDRG